MNYIYEPAFPTLELNQTTGDVCAQHLGMSLRDHFAGLAMQGDIASLAPNHCIKPEQTAKTAYAVANAMLKERAK